MAEQGKMAMASLSSVIAAKQSSLPVSYHPYPQPLARYEDVVVSRQLFMDTLGKLHATMRTKFMIPVIGGKDLNLHRLFIAVTSRGGIWRILNEKRWKEVTAIFSFPSSATNASFILRKYYLSLLQHYEQIYYFKAKGWTESADALHNVPTATASGNRLDASVLPLTSVATASSNQVDASVSPFTIVKEEATSQSQVKTAQPLSGATPAPITVVGVVDGKFESGYFVTVTIGSETLKGVLYKTPQNAADQVTQNHSTSKTRDKMATTTGVLKRKRRKKCETRKRDPAHPKPNRSGYNFFFAEQHARLKPLYRGKDRDMSRMTGDLWNKLYEADKAVYQEKAVRDRERYMTEMEDYKKMLKTGQVISNVLPIQQLPPNFDINMIDADGRIETEGGESPQTLDTDLSSGMVQIEVQNVGLGSLVDEKASELQNGVVKNGRKGEEFMEADDQMESQKKSAPRPSKAKDSEEPTQRDTVTNKVITQQKIVTDEDNTATELHL